jgi:NAD+ kinase
MSNHSNLAKTTVGLRELAKKIGEAPLTWERAPKYCMIVSKLSDPTIVALTMDVAAFLLQKGLQVYVQNKLYQKFLGIPHVSTEALSTTILRHWDEDQFHDNGQIDFVVTLGGDGTVLYASWLFQRKAPPIVPFNLGSLGFLTVFDLMCLDSTIDDILNCENVKTS